MVSFSFPEYFVGKVSAQGLISEHGASSTLAREHARPHTCSSASGLHSQQQPPPSRRGAPPLAICQCASAMTSRACGPALALLTDTRPSSRSPPALPPLELLLESISPRDRGGWCEMGKGRGNNLSPFWPEQMWNQEQRLSTNLLCCLVPCRPRGTADHQPVHHPVRWGYLWMCLTQRESKHFILSVTHSFPAVHY